MHDDKKKNSEEDENSEEEENLKHLVRVNNEIFFSLLFPLPILILRKCTSNNKMKKITLKRIEDTDEEERRKNIPFISTIHLFHFPKFEGWKKKEKNVNNARHRKEMRAIRDYKWWFFLSFPFLIYFIFFILFFLCFFSPFLLFFFILNMCIFSVHNCSAKCELSCLCSRIFFSIFGIACGHAAR